MKRTKNQVRHDPASQAAPSPKWRTGQGTFSSWCNQEALAGFKLMTLEKLK
ncbi:MAG: hypothetical protein AAFQ68_13105 [Bacteroidota bacterium]